MFFDGSQIKLNEKIELKTKTKHHNAQTNQISPLIGKYLDFEFSLNSPKCLFWKINIYTSTELDVEHLNFNGRMDTSDIIISYFRILL